MTKNIKLLKTAFFSFLLLNFIGFSHAQVKDAPIIQQQVDETQGAAQQNLQLDNSAQTAPEQQTYEGVIVGVTNENLPTDPQDTSQNTTVKEYIQKINIKITNGDEKGKIIESSNTVSPQANSPVFKLGDRVTILSTTEAQGTKSYFVTDYLRRDAIYLAIGVVFLFSVLLIRWRGISFFAGIVYSLAIVYKLLVPRLLAGANPVLMTTLCALLIAPVIFYLAYGLSKKTSIALAGTIISVFITGIVAITLMKLLMITGFASQEALFIQITTNVSMNMKGMFLGGILIGSLGLLEDLTIYQVNLVDQLKTLEKKKDQTDIFFMAVQQGQAHLGALLRTATFIFIGASLPLFILFLKTVVPAKEILNSEIVVNEIVIMLTYIFGLLLCVPITSILAARFLKEDANLG